MNNFYHIEKAPPYSRCYGDDDVFWIVRGKPIKDYEEDSDDGVTGSAFAMFFEEKDAKLFLEAVSERDGYYPIMEIARDEI